MFKKHIDFWTEDNCRWTLNIELRRYISERNSLHLFLMHFDAEHVHDWLESNISRITELYFGEEASPQRAHLLYCSGWRSATRPTNGRCTTVTRWDSWRCRSRWCPAGRGRCPGSQCPNGPNTPPPPHTGDGKREGERGKRSRYSNIEIKASQAGCLFWDAIKVHEVTV